MSETIQKIKNFLKTDFFIFIKNYLYLIILFSIIFYIILHINHDTKNNIIIIETKIFFYIGIFVLFIIISDILATPLEGLQKFLLLIMISLILIYIVNYLIEYFYKINDNNKDKYKGKKTIFTKKLLITSCTSLAIGIIGIIYFYFNFFKQNEKMATDLFNSFNFSIKKNLSFLLFVSIYLFIYKHIYDIYNINTQLTDILSPSVLGVLLIFLIFCLIIYICLKLKIINKIHILNSFIALGAILSYLSLMCLNTFMSSLDEVCKSNETQSSIDEQERVSLLILLSIFGILWLDDTRNWHQLGSLIFIVISLFTLFCMFYYSTIHPSTGLLSLWLFIEWLIIIFYRKENSKNAIHYSFMNT
jgi:hypothetical protein